MPDIEPRETTRPTDGGQMCEVGGVRLYVEMHGDGPPVLLLHGWPQTSRTWRRGAASLPACRVRDRGRPRLGRGLAFALAARYPDDVAALGVVEMLLPGLGPLEEAMAPRSGGSFLWHVAFHSVPDVPELLIAGHERAYLRWFFEEHAHDSAGVPAAELDVYASALSDERGLRASLGVYRAYFETASQVAALGRRPLSCPVVAYGGDASLGEAVVSSARLAIPAATGGLLECCAHWALDEQPEQVAGVVRDLVSAAEEARA